FAREFISKVQQMRKNNDYEILDTIKIYYNGPDSVEKAVMKFEDYIKKETLATDIIKVDEEFEQKQDLNGELTGIRLEKN
ncbi:DUF5915 domain-containing protein, partial [Vibrio parahaemolyticus]|nr:DUF5915 domain-containing protein [Vibrio parahaemolyticus]